MRWGGKAKAGRGWERDARENDEEEVGGERPNVGVRKRRKRRGEEVEKVRKRMKRAGGNKVFKLLITTGRNTASSKKEKQIRESDRVTGEAERWRSWRRGRGGVRESCSEDFN